MLENWLKARLPSDEARIVLVALRALFAGVDETRIVQFLETLIDRDLANSKRLWDWQGSFLQMKRSGLTGEQVMTALEGMVSRHGLTGTQLNTFWSNTLGPTGGSDILITCIQQLISNHNGLNGASIRDLLLLFLALDGGTTGIAPKIRLTKIQLRDCLICLRTKFSPIQVRSFCFFFQRSLPTGLHNLDTSFVQLCQAVEESTFTPQQISMTISVHAGITDPQLSQIFLTSPFSCCMDFLVTPLPIGVALPPTVVLAPSLLGYACTASSASIVARVLSAAHAARVPMSVLARLFCHLQNMTAGDKVQRLISFIEGARVAKETGKRKHTWAEIMDLVDLFVAQNRPANGPGGVAGGAWISDRRLRCPGERITYFVTAHSYTYFNFSIVDRSRDDITFFPVNTTVVSMRTLVVNVLQRVTNEEIEEALDSDKIEIQNVTYLGNDYEVGLLGNRRDNTVVLIHFMPFTVDPAHYWHKSLLSAIGFLF